MPTGPMLIMKPLARLDLDQFVRRPIPRPNAEERVVAAEHQSRRVAPGGCRPGQ